MSGATKLSVKNGPNDQKLYSYAIMECEGKFTALWFRIGDGAQQEIGDDTKYTTHADAEAVALAAVERAQSGHE